MAITWIKGPFDGPTGEKREFERVALQWGGEDNLRENMAYLKKEYARSSPKPLLDAKWRTMANTGSWQTDSINKIIKNLKKDNVKRDVSRIVNQFIGPGEVNDFNGRVSCPIVLRLSDGSTELIAGNTRLSMARALGVQPKIIELITDW